MIVVVRSVVPSPGGEGSNDALDPGHIGPGNGRRPDRARRLRRPGRRSASALAPLEALSLASGALLYVPVYSHVYHNDGRQPLNLTALLSIRNTDRSAPLVLTRIDYHGLDGKLVRRELQRPVRLAPLAVTEVVVPEADTAGGSGASFLVEWAAERPVSDPVVECVMIGTVSSQGISFVCPGRVLSTRGPAVTDRGP
jgi:hypothetical protein